MIATDFNFDKLLPTEHMLKWLANKPYGFILETLTNMLNQQVAGSIIQFFEVTSEPDWLTGLLPAKEKDQGIVTRVGCAFEFRMDVQVANETYHLTGVYSWVGVHLDEPTKSRQKTWLDIDKTLEHVGGTGELKERVYFS